MDIFLLIVTIILAVVLFIVSFYILAIYCHPDDKGIGTHLVLKVLVILGLTLSWAQVLMVPLDVANSRGYGGDLDMSTFWQLIYVVIAIMIIILLPFSIFLYESDEDKSLVSRIFSAMAYQLVSLIISCIILFVSWSFFKYAEIPIQVYTGDAQYFQSSSLQLSSSFQANIKSQQKDIEIQVSFIIYLMGLLSFIGWFLFSVFAPIGLVALPMELIQQFKHRPKPISSKEAANEKLQIKAEIKKLIDQGLQLQNDQKDLHVAQGGYWKTRTIKNQIQKKSDQFVAGVLSIEQDYDIFKQQLNYYQLNPLVFWGKLALGILLSICSFILWLHIIIYQSTKIDNRIPTHPFLNTMLIELDQAGAGFIASTIFSGILIYLLLCSVKGNFKCGVRIPFLFTLHPMKENETFMNSFIFNVMLILMCSVSLTQFSTQIFSDYCRFTTIEMFYGHQVANLKFFKYFFQNNVFGYIFVGIGALTLIYLLIFPDDKPKELQEYEKKIKQKKKNKK